MITLKEKAKLFEEYYNSDNDFLSYLRLNYEWDQSKFDVLVKLIKSVLDEYSEEPVFPKTLLHFFYLDLKLIEGIISNPLFYKSPPANFSSEQYSSYLINQLETLKNLQRIFLGKRS
ncbi:hypothetical protein RCC89_18835 [Cytophagaceae bacterium ABcell3]|nr:hypothetical protein RCC89_18835 [Cytophagaceae bacterium ABcell3]